MSHTITMKKREEQTVSNAVMKQNKDRKGYVKFSLYGGYLRTRGLVADSKNKEHVKK